ncbi:DNA polymerase [Polynucleobacter meluiroseus]|uniref:DNA polymerase n=1 Tax=Polynucleobacter meluiroseus TaxID=1938814 RepID=A0A240E077_9BURK|nr:DNA polymerase III subunit psi [Polynucleobacter meluiroseus]SNX28617.1 DNA polymerase [Polynucleobacter meluiroseus]
MNREIHSAFLKEMGVTEWALRDAPAFTESTQVALVEGPSVSTSDSPQPNITGTWWFFGSKPQAEAEALLLNIVRVLGLDTSAWAWKLPTELVSSKDLPQEGVPIVAIAFGESATKKLSGERDSLNELRQTVLEMVGEGVQEIPLIATFDLQELIARPQTKALFWQDLLLAKSVLQNS